MRPQLSVVETLAREAGAILRAGFGSHLHITHKGQIDLVTEIDHQAEAFLLAEINARFPGHAVLAEESGQQTGNPAHLWLVDPLDGTVNYAHGVPIFSVSVAYAAHGQLTLGAVYDPLRDECFTAAHGAGAWLNGQPLRVSPAQTLAESLLVTGFPYDSWTSPQNNLDHFARFAVRTQGVRRLGSAALDLCYVAAGRFDGFWELKLSPWDVAAGGLIAREAGAVVTNFAGSPDFLAPPLSILAANPALHPLMKAVLDGAGQPPSVPQFSPTRP